MTMEAINWSVGVAFELLVESRYSRPSVSYKWYFVECKQSYFDKWYIIQYLLESTAAKTRH